MSLVSVYDAEWRKRKINLFSVLRSFVSQLSPGQELTKVSLPSELCHPFSMLELVAFRELQLFHILFEINQETDPLARFLAVVKWNLGLVREETMEKKPFNPVVGETHLCWSDHGEGDFSEFIGEQVSHHPPISAFIIRNKKRNLSIAGAVTFKVGFGSNCASVTTGGEVMIHTGEESYTMTKSVPDMMVNNVIWGDKYLMWHGTLTITCTKNNYIAKIVFSEVQNRNLIEGEILEGDKPLFKISGYAGQKSYLRDISKEDFEDKLLVDISSYKDNTIFYLPAEVQTAFNSLKLWKPVKEAIINNDMTLADEEKKKIEADQRVRQKQRLSSGDWKDAQYFVFHPKEEEGLTEEEILERGVWEFKNNFSIDQEYITAMIQEADQIRADQIREAKIPNDEEVDDEPDSPETDTCSVQ